MKITARFGGAIVLAAFCVGPVGVAAQNADMPTVGYLSASIPETNKHVLESFHLGLRKMGYMDGKNIRIIYHWARGDLAKLPSMASDLMSSKVNVIVASGGTAAITTAMKATASIPIVFGTGSNPLQDALVKSLARPSANVTGASFYSDALTSKVFQYLKIALPRARRVAFVLDPRMPDTKTVKEEIDSINRNNEIAIDSFAIKSAADVRRVMESILMQKYDAVLTGSSPLLNNSRRVVMKYANSARIPVFATTKDYVTSGAILGYAASREEMFIKVGQYTGQILRGARPAELPVLLPTGFELVLNLRGAKVLGINMPSALIALANEIIE